MTKEILLKKLKEFSTLRFHDWNSAVTISDDVLIKAQNFVQKLEIENMLEGWEVYPTYHSTIQLERSLPYINVELLLNGQYEIYTEKPWHFECRLKDTKEVIDFIKNYVSKYNNEQLYSIT